MGTLKKLHVVAKKIDTRDMRTYEDHKLVYQYLLASEMMSISGHSD